MYAGAVARQTVEAVVIGEEYLICLMGPQEAVFEPDFLNLML